MVNARFVKPLDHELILSLVRSIPTVLTIEENTLAGGFGSAVLELLSDKGMAHVSVKRLGVADCFVEHGPQDVLRRKYKVDAAAIVRAAIELKESTTAIYQNGHQEATRYAAGR